MKINNARQKADDVLRRVTNELIINNNIKDINVTIESYQNGREQGHALWCINKKDSKTVWVAMAEHRNSDAIVVYYDEHNPMQSLSKKAYRNAMFFHNAHEANTCILGLIYKISNEVL